MLIRASAPQAWHEPWQHGIGERAYHAVFAHFLPHGISRRGP